MTDRELMQQALEALDWISRANAMDYEYRIKANEVLLPCASGWRSHRLILTK